MSSRTAYVRDDFSRRSILALQRACGKVWCYSIGFMITWYGHFQKGFYKSFSKNLRFLAKLSLKRKNGIAEATPFPENNCNNAVLLCRFIGRFSRGGPFMRELPPCCRENLLLQLCIIFCSLQRNRKAQQCRHDAQNAELRHPLPHGHRRVSKEIPAGIVHQKMISKGQPEQGI